jgi:hypothetical protein
VVARRAANNYHRTKYGQRSPQRHFRHWTDIDDNKSDNRSATGLLARAPKHFRCKGGSHPATSRQH